MQLWLKILENGGIIHRIRAHYRQSISQACKKDKQGRSGERIFLSIWDLSHWLQNENEGMSVKSILSSYILHIMDGVCYRQTDKEEIVDKAL